MKPGRDHYSILGVASDASQDDIRQAYLERARRYHPDSGEADASHEAFVELQRAYECLSEPDERRRYDRDRVLPRVPHPVTAHDLLRAQALRSRGKFWDDLFADEPWDSLSRMFAGLGPQRRESGTRAEVALEVTVTPQEARDGVSRMIGVPVPSVCVDCAGQGFDACGRCASCLGAGQVRAMRSFPVRIPAGTAHGAVFRTAVAASPGAVVDLAVRVLVRRA